MPDNAPIHDPDLFGQPLAPVLKGELVRRFVIPPFSVLDSRSGRWRTRKDAWLRLGIRSNHARDSRTYNCGTTAEMEASLGKGDNLGGRNNALSRKERMADPDWEVPNGDDPGAAYFDTSHFDPVLCELMYDWLCPPGGVILDPFAGCSVSGMVAALLGRRFWGSDLSAAQVAENCKVADTLPPDAIRPTWVVGDAAEVLPSAPKCDLVWTCPPYHDLEVYSKDPADLSTMDWDTFRSAYDDICAKAADRLKDDRFAAVTIGDVRDSKGGNYRNLPAFTTACFRRAGMELYNEVILVTAVGSLSMRTGRQFEMTRKFGRTHQAVMIYVKGNARNATDAITGTSAEERRKAIDARTGARQRGMAAWEDSEPEKEPT